MSDQHGGYREPANPAPVSGPGKLARRTDGAQPQRYVSGLPYGQGQELLSTQQSAPMAAPPNTNTRQGSAASVSAAPPPIPLDAPTERPSEPVTEGNPLGDGNGPNVLTHGAFAADSAKELPDTKARWLPALLHMADDATAPPSFVRFVRTLRDS